MPIKNTLTNSVGVDASPFKNDKFSAEGGIITTFVSGGLFYFTHQYTASGEFVIKSAQSGISAQILVVAGGGGGGASAAQFVAGGGGGAGGLIYSASYGIAPYENNYYFDVCVGNGDAPDAGILAQTSSFAPRTPYPVEVGYPIVAVAGGRGAIGGLTGSNGGSGGGSANSTTGSGTVGQGFDGTLGLLSGGNTSGGGGGGASQKAQITQGGSGSFYSFYDLTGSFFAGGGGGGGTQAGQSNGFGGPGGGGTGGQPGSAGTNYLGAGGGGGFARSDSGGSNKGGYGGSGSVYITYTVPLT